MGYGRRLVRNLWRSVVVAAVIAGIALGLPAINARIPALQPVAPAAIDIGGDVTLVPPRGTSLDTTQTRPGESRGQALFYIDSIRYAVVVTPYTGSLSAAASRLRHEITERGGYQIAGSESSARTTHGVPGLQGMYSSPGRYGRYAVFVARGYAVTITVAGNDVDLRRLLPRIGASVRSVKFTSR